MLNELGEELGRAESLRASRVHHFRSDRRRKLRLAWRSAAAAGIAALATTGVATATGLVAAPWQPLFGSPTIAEPQPAVTSAGPPSDQINSLAVLRRAQTPADRASATPSLRYFGVSTVGVRTDYIRSVAISPSRAAVLVPAALWQASPPSGSEITKHDVVCLFVPENNRDGGAKGCYTTAEIRDGAVRVVVGDTFYSLVPDGVSRVRADFGNGNVVDSRANENIVSLATSKDAVPWPLNIAWLANDGSTIKQITLRTTPLRG